MKRRYAESLVTPKNACPTAYWKPKPETVQFLYNFLYHYVGRNPDEWMGDRIASLSESAVQSLARKMHQTQEKFRYAELNAALEELHVLPNDLISLKLRNRE